VQLFQLRNQLTERDYSQKPNLVNEFVRYGSACGLRYLVCFLGASLDDVCGVKCRPTILLDFVM
jgi:hypothetical protein